jgi:hypothetical protein
VACVSVHPLPFAGVEDHSTLQQEVRSGEPWSVTVGGTKEWVSMPMQYDPYGGGRGGDPCTVGEGVLFQLWVFFFFFFYEVLKLATIHKKVRVSEVIFVEIQ